MDQNKPFVCPKTGKSVGRPRLQGWAKWLFPLLGFGSLLWFLIRVLPKPSRAGYPCQRAAVPFASAFVVWLLGLGAVSAFRISALRLRKARYVLAGVFLLLGVGIAIVAVMYGPGRRAAAFSPTDPLNTPMGVGKGVHPGRVAWVHDPAATQGEVLWDESTGYYWDDPHNNQAVIDNMMGKTIRYLAGEDTDAGAWNSLFRYHNRTKNNGDVGYQPGEKIIIKVNLNNAIDWNFTGVENNKFPADPAMYDRDVDNESDITPQAVVALLRQLINQAGVPKQDIYITDSIRYWTKKYWDRFMPEFQGVHFLDVVGQEGRELMIPTATDQIIYSIHDGTVDKIPQIYTEAKYMINFAILKKTGVGITCCNKNHFGSLTVSPAHVHHLAWDESKGYATMDTYSCYTDYIAHKDIGGKTFLYLLDGLWAGWYSYGVQSMPHKWQIAPFNNDWPSSFLASQDPVAIDSVALDFLRSESPGDDGNAYSGIAPGADNFMHEAALADNPPSGTAYDPENDGTAISESLGVHEHWNNAVDKQYSRNLGTGNGIELTTTGLAPRLMQVKVTANQLSPKPIGTPITLTATPYGGSIVEYQYRAGYQDATGWHWSVVNAGNYITSNTCVWTPQQPRTYTLVAWAREVGHTNAYDVYGKLTFLAAPTPISAVTLNANLAAPKPINTTITLTAGVTGGYNVQYRFRAGYQDASGWHWADLNSYSTATTCNWTPTTARTYTLVVWVRESGHTANYDAYKAISYAISAIPMTSVALAVTPASPQMVGTVLTLKATPTGGSKPEYRFRAGYQDATGWHWNDLQWYSTSTECNWAPSDARLYTFAVWAREVGTTVNYKVYGSTTFRVTK